jgi:uncharacterized Tic20 family protein
MTTDPQTTQTEPGDTQATEPQTEPETIAAETTADVAASEDELESVEPTASDAVETVTPDSMPEPEPLTSESRNWATFAHLSAFVMFLGIPSLIGPLVVWLAKKDDPYVEAQAKEALNFNISMLIYAIAAGISILLVIGIIALPVVFVTWFVLVIIAAIRSADGEAYRYPFTIRLVS